MRRPRFHQRAALLKQAGSVIARFDPFTGQRLHVLYVNRP